LEKDVLNAYQINADPVKIHLVSLGCDKNLVDSEIMMGLLTENGYPLTGEPSEAAVILINTCGFIESATRESLQAIMEMAAYKEQGVCKALVVAGCMAQRYREEILKNMPEVDAVVGVDELQHIAKVVSRLLEKPAPPSAASLNVLFENDLSLKRVISTPFGFAYLKIAEGCDGRCTFCTIPALKGVYRSRSLPGLLQEARKLVDAGTREIILVAQDTALYGWDLYGQLMLSELLRQLAQIEELRWIRVLYAYPENISDELIQEMAANPKVCHYIDMPIQHGSDGVLKRMGRKTDANSLRRLVAKLRAAMPDIALRTTIMVGFPGETEEEFAQLLRFVQETRFDKLGVFTYSREADTPASEMPEQVPQRKKIERQKKIMAVQREISLHINQSLLGETLEVMVEGRFSENDDYVYCGRSFRDCHEIDGLVFFPSEEEKLSGEFIRVKITKAHEHDLFAAIIE
jgi:ribosomal protein S12 methylthiotransferase